jgi:hypothetical protein
MAIDCPCGHELRDGADYLPHVAHIIPDQEYFHVLDAIDEAIERSGPSPKEKVDACMRVRHLIGTVTKHAMQCVHCGRVYIHCGERRYKYWELVPSSAEVPRELFRSRPAFGGWTPDESGL